MPNHAFGTLEVCRHGTPPAFPQFGVYREGEQNDIATVHCDNARAYASLFAESPKLLDACHLRLEIVEFEYENDPEPEDLPSWKEAIDQARAAIAAATGAP